jgi:hypothetical protein
MGSGAIGFSNDGIAEVSVDFAMLCYRQSEEKSAKAPLTHKVRGVRGNPILGKMSRCAGSAVALNPQRCPLRRGRSPRLYCRSLDLHVLWCRKFIAKGSGMCNKGDRSRCPARRVPRTARIRTVVRNRRRGQIPALDPGELRGAKTIGVTAGAPAPEILVPEILVEDVTVASSALGRVEFNNLARGRGKCRIHATGRTQRSSRRHTGEWHQ